MIGALGHAEHQVGQADTAIAIGSGDLPVLASPIMIALMEAAACDALAGLLPPESTSVGTHVDVRHLAPSAVGATVTATAEVVDVQGTRITFRVSARHSSQGGPVEIGAGTHVRVVVPRDRFLAAL
jgi:fluoroacetyl-CoA thioesterase